MSPLSWMRTVNALNSSAWSTMSPSAGKPKKPSGSVKRNRNLIDSQSDIIARSDSNGKLTFVNDAYCQVFGKTREELLGKGFTPTVLAEGTSILRRMCSRKLRDHLTIALNLKPGIIPQRGCAEFSWENSAIVDKDGKVIELQGVWGGILPKPNKLNWRFSGAMKVWRFWHRIFNDALNQGESLSAIISLISAGFNTFSTVGVPPCIFPGRNTENSSYNIFLSRGAFWVKLKKWSGFPSPISNMIFEKPARFARQLKVENLI